MHRNRGLDGQGRVKMLAWIIALLLLVMIFSLAWQSLALRQQVEMLTDRLRAIERGQNKHQEAERRRHDYEIGFLESKASSLQHRVDALHARLDTINERSEDDPGGRAQAHQIRGINRRPMDDLQKFAKEISVGGETMQKGRDLIHHSSSPHFSRTSLLQAES
jgi:hypothetical protein